MARNRNPTKPSAAEIEERDRSRDIGAELLESIRQFKSGKVGAILGPPDVLLLRYTDLSALGDLSAGDLQVGRSYIGRLDREGWVRVVDDSGKDGLYPRACFQFIASGADARSGNADDT